MHHFTENVCIVKTFYSIRIETYTPTVTIFVDRLQFWWVEPVKTFYKWRHIPTSPSYIYHNLERSSKHLLTLYIKLFQSNLNMLYENLNTSFILMLILKMSFQRWEKPVTRIIVIMRNYHISSMTRTNSSTIEEMYIIILMQNGMIIYSVCHTKMG